ncbi:hypothetical protein VZT92_014882 [Zoarces viviparus]|uniref:Uncharacterized protein n=1 Tax=Zoarces viviparus TaxID=48416 RepID=A0AAW1EUU5_ZOAVI
MRAPSESNDQKQHSDAYRFPDMRGDCVVGRATAVRGLEGGGERRRRDTPIACQAEMGYLKVGMDVKRGEMVAGEG